MQIPNDSLNKKISTDHPKQIQIPKKEKPVSDLIQKFNEMHKNEPNDLDGVKDLKHKTIDQRPKSTINLQNENNPLVVQQQECKETSNVMQYHKSTNLTPGSDDLPPIRGNSANINELVIEENDTEIEHKSDETPSTANITFATEDFLKLQKDKRREYILLMVTGIVTATAGLATMIGGIAAAGISTTPLAPLVLIFVGVAVMGLSALPFTFCARAKINSQDAFEKAFLGKYDLKMSHITLANMKDNDKFANSVIKKTANKNNKTEISEEKYEYYTKLAKQQANYHPTIETKAGPITLPLSLIRYVMDRGPILFPNPNPNKIDELDEILRHFLNVYYTTRMESSPKTDNK